MIFISILSLNEVLQLWRKTKGLEVSFTITVSGMTVIPNGSGGIQAFASGPFRPSFSLF